MPGCSGVAKASVTGTQDRLGPVGDLELGEDAGDMVRDRLGAHGECLGDLLVAA